MIAVQDNFITQSECLYLISFYLKNKNRVKQHEMMFPLSVYKDNYYKENDEIYSILMKAESFVKGIGVNVKTDWSNLVFWPLHSSQAFHKDKTDVETVYTSIIYLNENYRGGETCFEDGSVVSPVTGRILCFDGMKYPHAVKPIIGGSRYTLATWYKSGDE